MNGSSAMANGGDAAINASHPTAETEEKVAVGKAGSTTFLADEANAEGSYNDFNDETKVEKEQSLLQQPKRQIFQQEMNDSHTAEINTANTSMDTAIQQNSVGLNVALEALESMRRVNLELEFSTAVSSIASTMSSSSLVPTVHHDQCTHCQREALRKFLSDPASTGVNGRTAGSGSDGGSNSGGGGAGERRIKFDGRGIHRFRNNFFSKSSLVSENNGAENCDADIFADGYTESCPPRLGPSSNQSFSSMDSNEAGTTINDSLASAVTTPAPNNGISIEDNADRPHRSLNPRRKVRIPRPKPRPCLTCGHPTCPSHSSPTFSTRNIPICQPCAYLFELDFLVDVIATAASLTTTNGDDDDYRCLRRKVDDMIDCYDRAKLLLSYTAQYTDSIASALESRTARSNKIGVGSSATGIVSGIAGVVGCGALLFPPVAAVGMPLLIASLVFGGTATAAQTGNAAVGRYFSEPGRLAEKIVTLHGMVLSLLRITEVLAYGLLGGHFDEEGGRGSSSSPTSREVLAKEIQALLEKYGVNAKVGVGTLKTAVLEGSVVAEVVAATETTVVGSSTVTTDASLVGRSSRYFGRVGTAAMSSARFVPIAGGVLSAACLVVEGKELKRTLARISEGNPCAMAGQIRSIRDELDKLPDSSMIAAECRRVFELAKKQKLHRATLVGSKEELPNGQEEAVTLDETNGEISDLIDAL